MARVSFFTVHLIADIKSTTRICIIPSDICAPLGSLIGGAISFGFNFLLSAWMANVLSVTPFVQPHMIAFVDAVYSKHGYVGVLFQAFSFMQFKICTQYAVMHGFNPALYLLLLMISRAVRFGAVAVLSKEIGKRISGSLWSHALIFVVIYTILFFLC
jgi:membrane protein YqaA with SNARE-associated domain